MKLTTLEALFFSELRNLYDAEKQILKALRQMARTASSKKLKQAFEKHHAETEEQVTRIEKIFNAVRQTPSGGSSQAVRGLIEEADTVMRRANPAVLDAALIAAAQKVEHYEIAAYGCVRTYANRLGLRHAAKLLDQTLQEEGHADKQLTRLAEGLINQKVPQAPFATAKLERQLGNEGGITKFLFGLGIAVASALFFAPKSGHKTRRMWCGVRGRGTERPERGRVRPAADTTEQLIAQGRDLIAERRAGANRPVEQRP